jgi:hypothetical protein
MDTNPFCRLLGLSCRWSIAIAKEIDPSKVESKEQEAYQRKVKESEQD